MIEGWHAGFGGLAVLTATCRWWMVASRDATVKSHLMRIFGTLGVTDRTAAVTQVMARGIPPRPTG
jgi:hypothetical protein